jgi:hypothetical protein
MLWMDDPHRDDGSDGETEEIQGVLTCVTPYNVQKTMSRFLTPVKKRLLVDMLKKDVFVC